MRQLRFRRAIGWAFFTDTQIMVLQQNFRRCLNRRFWENVENGF